jgi:hypothetical protein
MRSLWSVVTAVGLVAAAAQAQDPGREWTLPSSGDLFGSKATIENQPCCGPNRNTRVHSPDTAALAKWSGLASRDGRTLMLKLAGNRTLQLTDCDDETGCDADDTRIHRLVDWWPEHRLYVVLVGLYEGSGAYLVSERDGRTLGITAPPVLSPSGRQAVALVSDLLSGVNLEIIDLSRNPPTVATVTAMPDCGDADPNSFLRPIPVWTDDRHVSFEGESPLPEDKPNTKQLLRVEGGKGQWQC